MYLRELSVFLASPSDLEEERDLAVSVVAELNRTIAKSRELVLTLYRYEDNAVPGLGVDVQDAINQSFGNNFDILIGMFWTRVGTPTKRALSGTLEEIQLAIEKYKDKPNQKRIMLYFKTASVSPFEVDIEQLKKVQMFRNHLSSLEDNLAAFYSTFESPEDFKDLLRVHLTRQILGWGETWGSEDEAHHIEKNDVDDPSEGYEEEEEIEEGLYDLIETIEAQMQIANEATHNMTDAMTTMGNGISKRSSELTQENSKKIKDRAKIKRILSLVAKDMDSFVQRAATELPIHSEAFNDAMNAYSKALLIFADDFDSGKNELKVILDSLQSLSTSLQSTLENIYGLYKAIKNTPRITTAWNRAKASLLKSIKNIISTFAHEQKLVSALIDSIESIDDLSEE